MVAATLTPDLTFTPGLKYGSVSAKNGETSNFGFKTLKGVILTTSDNNDIIAGCSISSGNGTITLVDDAGSAETNATKLFYCAWGK